MGVFSHADTPARHSASDKFRSFAENGALAWQSWKSGHLSPADVADVRRSLDSLEQALGKVEVVEYADPVFVEPRQGGRDAWR